MSPAVFAHGHLRLYLLSLLDDRPQHGYELIQSLSDRFGGSYVPSAGTIYPRLAKLEEEGLIVKRADGRKSVYEITDAGRRELADREHELDGIESALGDSVRRLADEVRSSVNDAMRSLRAELAAAADEGRDETRWATRDTTAAQRGEPGSAADEDPAASSKDPQGTAPGEPFLAAGESDEPSDTTDARLASRTLLHEAELALTDFRQELRGELREASRSASLERATVDAVHEALQTAAHAVRQTLRSSR